MEKCESSSLFPKLFLIVIFYVDNETFLTAMLPEHLEIHMKGVQNQSKNLSTAYYERCQIAVGYVVKETL